MGYMKQARGFLKDGVKFVLNGVTTGKNRSRDAKITLIAIFVLVGVLFSGKFQLDKEKDYVKEDAVEVQENDSEEALNIEIVEELRDFAKNTDMSQWKKYENPWFGFALKFPQNWKAPFVSYASKNVGWEQKISFRRLQVDQDNSYAGFDALVYETKEDENIMNIQEFPDLNEGMVRSEGVCDTIDGHTFETGDYPAEEIYISSGDDCYETGLLFTFTLDEYTYVLLPVKKNGLENFDDQRMEIMTEMPEFFAIASTLESIEIVRKAIPAQKIVTKRITAPKPAVFEKDALGRMVCNKKHDKPGKSKINNKGKIHMDMECCLDPDEYPNPHCYYDPKKYGKYMNKNIPK
jgi:hypothetical protein